MSRIKKKLYFSQIKGDRYYKAAFETIPDLFLMDYFELDGDPSEYIWIRKSDKWGKYIQFKRKRKGNVYFM